MPDGDPHAGSEGSEYPVVYRNNIFQRDDCSVLHDKRLLRQGNVPHPARDGHVRAARLSVIGNEIFDGRLRAVRQMGYERGKLAVQFFGLLRGEFAPSSFREAVTSHKKLG